MAIWIKSFHCVFSLFIEFLFYFVLYIFKSVKGIKIKIYNSEVLTNYLEQLFAQKTEQLL